MQTLCTKKDADCNFGQLIEMARAEPVTVEKHGRTVVVVLTIEEYEPLVGPVREIGNRHNTKKRDE